MQCKILSNPEPEYENCKNYFEDAVSDGKEKQSNANWFILLSQMMSSMVQVYHNDQDMRSHFLGYRTLQSTLNASARYKSKHSYPRLHVNSILNQKVTLVSCSTTSGACVARSPSPISVGCCIRVVRSSWSLSPTCAWVTISVGVVSPTSVGSSILSSLISSAQAFVPTFSISSTSLTETSCVSVFR